MELLPVLEIPEPEQPREEKEVTIEHTDLTDTSTETQDIFINAPKNEENIKTIPKKTKKVRMAEIATLMESEDEAEECDYHAPPLEKEVEKEVEIPISPPPKPKKPKSAKQLAHLKRIRVLAAEKKRANRLEKEAIEEVVKEKMKKKKQAQKAEDVRFSEDFKIRMGIKSDEEMAKIQAEREANMYSDFLLNMKKFNTHAQQHNVTPSAPPPPKPAPKKPTPPPPCAPINIIPDNPYSSAFDW